MAINLDIMKEIDFNVQWDWTIDEFLIMAEKVKQTFGGTRWATGMFAANQSGDYLINNWFASFGAEYYQNGDYSHTTIKDTGGERVYEFFQHLAEHGYIPPGSATLSDDDYVIQWAKGDLAATAFFQSWTDPYFKTVIDQGLARKSFDYIFVPFPRGSGVESVPTYLMSGAIVVHKTGTEVDAIAARYAEYLNGAMIQEEYAKQLSLPNRIDVKGQIEDPHTAEIMSIVSENGLFDVGLSTERFTLTRPQHYPILQRVLNNDISPQEAINLYEQKINEVLK
jgi:ABC-type glycerol-3-phosphate transport system substrate-binding protein